MLARRVTPCTAMQQNTVVRIIKSLFDAIIRSLICVTLVRLALMAAAL